MNSQLRFNLIIVLGAFVFGGVIGAISSATGYAAYLAETRSFWSPTATGIFGVLGGALLSLRISLERSWQTSLKVAFAIGCAAALGSICYLTQAYHLGTRLAALPTAEYALFFAGVFSVVAAISCLCANTSKR